MTALGSVFEPEGEGRKGRDLRHAITVRRDQLGAPIAVAVPLEIALDDDVVARAVGPGEQGDQVVLNLPETVPSGATLRLRGQGEALVGGRPGDLYLTITITEKPGPQAPYGGWALAAAVLILGVIAWVVIK